MQQFDLDGHWKYDNILWIGSSKQQAASSKHKQKMDGLTVMQDHKQAQAKDHKQALAA